MKFMVEFQLKPGSKIKAVEAFELRGPNRHSGAAFRGAWVAAEPDLVYVLVESPDESQVAKVVQSWGDHGVYQITRVIDVDQF